MPRPLRLEVTVTSLAPRGDGVAHAIIDGERRAIFLPATATGDILRADVDPSKRPARGHVVEVLAAGADRVTPACPWSLRCGGCDWMHLSTAAQRATHVEHVRAALPAAWRGIDVLSHGAAETLRYRSRARLHVRCERGRVEVGMHGARTNDPVAVEVCAVLDPAVEAGRRLLPALFEGTRGRGDAQIALGVGRRPVLELRWSDELAPVFFARLEKAVGDGRLAGARVSIDGASRPAVVGDPTPWMQGADDEPLRLAPGGFGQASERMNASLVRHIAEVLRPWAIDRGVELYAGSGNLSVVLAREVRELVVVESSRDNCDAARANLAARGLDARVVEADAEGFVWSPATQLVVLDPPRTGARPVAERLARSRVARVLYASCDPQTLGRDLGILAEAYAPASVATFEMFPQTSHVETVVALERRRPAKRGRA